MEAAGKIRVLIIDDSAVMRRLLADILNDAGDIEVVGTAQDPIFAMDKIRSFSPDVITLDVEMPRMDGLTFLKELMGSSPVPVVMVSALTGRGCETTLRALELGAVDYVSKPSIDVSRGIAGLGDEICRKVRIAAKARPGACRVMPCRPGAANTVGQSSLDTQKMATTGRIIAIGASTGGTQAITEVITGIPQSTPGIVIVQHMPPVLSRSFAERLNSLSKLDVKEAVSGDRILRGTVLLAPGNRHMAIRRSGAMYYVEVMDGPMVNYVRPSVDVLFRSVAQYAGKNAMGLILTGMGEDGARGLLEMKAAGALTVAQDEASSIIFGMPKKAIEMGAADRVVSLSEMAGIISAYSTV